MKLDKKNYLKEIYKKNICENCYYKTNKKCCKYFSLSEIKSEFVKTVYSIKCLNYKSK